MLFQSLAILQKEKDEKPIKASLSFLIIAQGSCNELETQLLIAAELKYVSKETFQKVQNDTQEIQKMLTTFISKLKS